MATNSQRIAIQMESVVELFILYSIEFDSIWLRDNNQRSK